MYPLKLFDNEYSSYCLLKISRILLFNFKLLDLIHIFKILFEELLYAEASGNHIKLITDKNTIVSTMTFTALEEQLPKTLFLRLHRSFIINKAKISHIEGNRVFIGVLQLPIGANYREAFLREIGI